MISTQNAFPAALSLGSRSARQYGNTAFSGITGRCSNIQSCFSRSVSFPTDAPGLMQAIILFACLDCGTGIREVSIKSCNRDQVPVTGLDMR
jgi:hypothetical protein